jgi:hypothetical protein
MSFSIGSPERTEAKGVPNPEIGSIALKLKDFLSWEMLKKYASCMEIPTERTLDSRLFPSPR